jgi:hypothetical protein
MIYVIIGVIVNLVLIVANHGKTDITLWGVAIAVATGLFVGLWRKEPIVGAVTLGGGYVAVLLAASQFL